MKYKAETDLLMAELLSLLTRMATDLERNGYIFDSPQSEFVLQAPLPDTQQMIDEMRTYFGSFPYVVASFFQTVGAVDFCGQKPTIEETDYPDPLQLIFDYGFSGFAKYRSDPNEKAWWDEGYGGFVFLISADYYHKEGVSGGPEYGFALPKNSDDPVLSNTPYGATFTFLNYLALTLKFACFPGYKSVSLEFPAYYGDASLVSEAQALSSRFDQLASLYAGER